MLALFNAVGNNRQPKSRVRWKFTSKFGIQQLTLIISALQTYEALVHLVRIDEWGRVFQSTIRRLDMRAGPMIAKGIPGVRGSKEIEDSLTIDRLHYLHQMHIGWARGAIVQPEDPN